MSPHWQTPMTRRFINELGENESLEQVYRVQARRLRSNKNGNLYMQLDLADRGGSVTAMCWNADQKLHDKIQPGEYVQVEGKTQLFNGSLQVIVNQLTPVETESVNEEDFFPISEQQRADLFATLQKQLDQVSHPLLSELLKLYLADEDLLDKLQRAPAAMKNHHAYHGGLLEHIVSLLGLVERVAPHYPELDLDLLLVGAFLHDLAKVDELSYDDDIGYTDEGELVGHLVMGVVMLDARIRQLEDSQSESFPAELALRLKHMIVSHHGRLEYGSPKLPMTPEALALSFLDDLDAKMQAYRQAAAMDTGYAPGWTNYIPAMGRKLYRGTP